MIPSCRLRLVLLAALASAAGVGLLFQYRRTAALRAELVDLRRHNVGLAAVREEHRRLAAQQPEPAELERLRHDRAALDGLRRELAALPRPAGITRTVRVCAPAAMIPAAGWRNAGTATPGAALETLLWAARGGDLGAFAAVVDLTPEQWRRFAAQLGQRPAERLARLGDADRLVPAALAASVPASLSSLGILTQTEEAAGRVQLRARLQSDAGWHEATFSFQRSAAGWRMTVPDAVIDDCLRSLGEPPAG